MTFDDLIFIDHLPTLDLHGFDERSAILAISDFILDHQKMGHPFLVIIHGVGTGVLRRATIRTLQTNKNVCAFKLSNFNTGCTIVQIKN